MQQIVCVGFVCAYLCVPQPDARAENREPDRILRKEVVVEAPVESVWAAWTTEKGIASFFSPTSRIKLRPGGSYELYMGMTEPDASGLRGSEGCKVLSYIPHEMLAFEWNFPPSVMSLRKAGAKTQVVLQFDEPEKNRTRIRFAQLGWQEGADWDAGYAYFDKAWGWVLDQLAAKAKAGELPKVKRSFKHENKTWTDGQVKVTEFAGQKKRQDFEMTLPIGVEKVWAALATEEGFRLLGAEKPAVELRPGGKYAFWPEANNKVMAFVPLEMLSTSGSAPKEFPNVRKGGTWSAYFLEATGENETRLRLAVVGWKKGEEWDRAFAYFLKNNPVFLNHLYDKVCGTAATKPADDAGGDQTNEQNEKSSEGSTPGDGHGGVHWPSFRGERASGVSEGYSTPTRWNVEAGQNIKWTKPIPGHGDSSPVIWGDRIFITTAIKGQGEQSGEAEKEEEWVRKAGVDHRWVIHCLDKKTGSVMWETTACEGPTRIDSTRASTHADNTPATDGRHVVTFFGSQGLFCFDVSGQLVWKKDLGVLDAGLPAAGDSKASHYGFASSPVIRDGRVFVQCDVFSGAFAAAFNLKTGEEVWRTPRDDVPTWSTPTVCGDGKDAQLVLSGHKQMGGYDLKTGRPIWTLGGAGDHVISTPVAGHGLIFITNLTPGKHWPLYAIHPGARGEISLKGDETSNPHIAWSTSKNGGFIQTPLVYGDYLYSCDHGGVLKCYEAKTGDIVYRERLGGGKSPFTPSPVAADNKIYFTSDGGDVFVVQAGREFKIIAENAMGEPCRATPAISEGVLYVRTRRHLVAVGGA